MTTSKKKPYAPPRIRSEKVIETAALACGKCLTGGPIFQSACKTRKKTS